MLFFLVCFSTHFSWPELKELRLFLHTQKRQFLSDIAHKSVYTVLFSWISLDCSDIHSTSVVDVPVFTWTALSECAQRYNPKHTLSGYVGIVNSLFYWSLTRASSLFLARVLSAWFEWFCYETYISYFTVLWQTFSFLFVLLSVCTIWLMMLFSTCPHAQQFFNFTMHLTNVYTIQWFGNLSLNVYISSQQSFL